MTYFKKLADIMADKGILSIKREGKLKFYGISSVLDEEKENKNNDDTKEEKVQDDTSHGRVNSKISKSLQGV